MTTRRDEAASAGLRERLGELVRSRRAGAVPAHANGTNGASDVTLPTSGPAQDRTATGVEAFLPGGEWRHDRHGAVYVHERLRSDVERKLIREQHGQAEVVS